ncbi:hypothetical protein [Peribacillus kribbensis]|uniref:hypothetical protein n=1 Tax=Peribacillus kribbensis TaxID=356658 RepID=UPI0003FFA5AF|nr:hypothetical protein [Peribacillus kribbensis]
MVNQDFSKFHKLQEKHKSVYLEGKDEHAPANKSHSNNKKTDYAPGVTGRS